MRALRKYLGIEHADDALFLVAYVIWMASTIIYYFTFFAQPLSGTPMQIIRWTFVAILVLSEVVALCRGERWSWRSFVGLAVVVALGICCFNANKLHMLWSLPVFFCARNRDFRAIAITSIVVMSCIMVAAIVCANLGIIQNIQTDKGGRVRHYLGFRYPLYPSMLLFSITCLACILLGNRMGFIAAAVLASVNGILFVYTNARLSFILSIVIVAAALIIAKKKAESSGKPPSQIAAMLVSSVFIVAATVSIIAAFVYNHDVAWMKQLNDFLGTRLFHGHNGLLEFGPSIIGQKVQLIGHGLSITGEHTTKQYNFIDCAYLQLLILLGLVYFLVYLSAMTIATYRLFLRDYTLVVAVLVVLAFQGMLDNLNLYLWACPIPLLLAGFISDKASIRWGSRFINALSSKSKHSVH